MSQTITPVPQYDTTALVRTVDGELISDTSGPAPYGPLLQALADRAALAKAGLVGQILWNHAIAVAVGGSNSSWLVSIGEIVACVVQCPDGAVRSFALNGVPQSVTQANLEVAGNLANGAWYYLYAKCNAGNSALEIIVNTTPPDASLMWQSAGGTNLRRYLGCFVTNGSGAPIPSRMHRGRYVYRQSAIASAHSIASYNGATGGFLDQSFASFVPPHARLATVLIDAANADQDSGDEVIFRWRTKGHTTHYEQIVVPRTTGADAADASRIVLTSEIETDASQVIQYEVAGSSSGLLVSLYARGFQE